MTSDQQTTPENGGASPSPANTRHKCYLCSRSYERADHLSRHLKSHDNERAYRCTDCGKGFNRADLLNRHRAAHSKASAGEVFRKRTPHACENCVKAKTKCDDERPCTRCRTREIACQETEGRNEDGRDDNDSTSSPPKEAASGTAVQLPTPASIARPPEEPAMAPNSFIDMTPSQSIQDSFAMDASMTDLGFSDFFEQIMMPEVTAFEPHDQRIMPPDVSNFTQDINLDAFDFDFSFLASGLTRPSSPQPQHDVGGASSETVLTPHSGAHLRSEALKRSPWSWNHWIPDRNHSAFTGQEIINVQEDRVNDIDQHVSPSVKRSVHCDLTQEARDRMIRIVTQIASSRLSMPSFPSLELLEDLIDIFLLQDGSAIDSFMHAPTFSCRESRTELLLAAVAAGSRFVALPPVWKMGLVFQEVVRLAVAELFETDNSTTRELGVLQVYLLWVGVGMWSGFRRKTEIACSFLQPAVTMLSWSNSFTKFRYLDFVPNAIDSEEVVNSKWRSWLEQEGRKRVVLHSFIHDSQVAMAHMQNRLISPSQMMLPLPAERELWLAPNAHAWRSSFLARQPLSQGSMPSVMEIFGNLSLLDTLSLTIDKPLCLMVACHALAQEVWQFRQESQLLQNWQQQHRRDRWLSHLNRQRDLLEDLTTIGTYCEMSDSTSPEITLTIEFLIMLLHVSLEDIQAFTGKSGEDEARKAFPRLLAWTSDSASRTAVWHAGQVLRTTRLFEKTKLRDFYAVALHQATLTLWVFGMVTSNSARKSGDRTPTPIGLGVSRNEHEQRFALSSGSPRVFMDDPNDKVGKSFKLLGQGVPGVRSDRPQSTFCPLSDSRRVLSVAEDILRYNFPACGNGLPPLVENLANLMNDLGRLSGK